MTSSVLLNLNVFIAENNIRRNVATLSGAYPGTSAQVTYRELAAGETWTYTPVSAPSLSSRILIAYVTGPVSATVTLAPNPDGRPVDSMQMSVSRILTCDDLIANVLFENTGSSSVSLTIIQG